MFWERAGQCKCDILIILWPGVQLSALSPDMWQWAGLFTALVLPSCCSPIRIVCSSDKAEIKIDRQHGHKEATRGPSIARQSASPNSHRTFTYWGLLQKAVCNMPQQEPCNHQTLSIQYHYVLSMMIWWVKAKISLTQPLMNDNWMIVNNYNYCY